MLNKEQVRQIKMGTFHALCAQFLRKYATLVGISGNFTVCDADERCAQLCDLWCEYMLTNCTARRF